MVGKPHIALSLEQPPKFKPCINQPHETFPQEHTIAKMERRQLASNIFDTRNNMRPNLDSNRENVGVRKDVGGTI